MRRRTGIWRGSCAGEGLPDIKGMLQSWWVGYLLAERWVLGDVASSEAPELRCAYVWVSWSPCRVLSWDFELHK